MACTFKRVILFFLFVCITGYPLPAWCDGDMSPHAYVLEKCRSYDLVFFGTTHKQPAILSLISDLLPSLTRIGITHLGLEIGSDQQRHIDAYLQSGGDPTQIKLADAIECPQYRQIFHVLYRLPEQLRPTVTALDLPVELYGKGIDRNYWMAMKLHHLAQSQRDAKIFIILGSIHVLHRLEWLPSVRYPKPSIRELLIKRQPDLTMFSIVNILASPKATCDFGRRLAPFSTPLAIDVDRRFRDWKMGLFQYVAIAPSQPWTLIDGIIVHPSIAMR